MAASLALPAPGSAAPVPGRWSVEFSVDRAIASAARRVSSGKARLARAEVACLAENIYFEARGESETGRAGVAHVTLNRHADPDFPESVCKVVREPSQFSWVRTHGKRPKGSRISDKEAFDDAAAMAVAAMLGLVRDPTEGATFFWSKCERSRPPEWARDMIVTAIIGCHVFLAGRRNALPAIEHVAADLLPRGLPEIGRFVYAEDEEEDADGEATPGISSPSILQALAVAEESLPVLARTPMEAAGSASPFRFALFGIVTMLWLSLALTFRRPIGIMDAAGHDLASAPAEAAA